MMSKIRQFTSPVITLEPEGTINDALFLMQKNDIKRVVIVQNNFPIGIVTERDMGRFLEHDKTTKTLDKIPIHNIMNRNLVTISVEDEDIATQSAIRMDTFQISSVIVVDNEGKLVGITTKSDLARIFASLYARAYRVADYMSKKIITCRKTDLLLFALDMLNKNKISRLVVTDNEGNPVGVITYDTFLRNSGFFKASKSTRDYLLPSANAKEMRVGDLIKDELLTVETQDDLATAAKLMTDYTVSGIPVVDSNGSLEGIISSTDIVKAYSEVETHFRLAKKDPHFE
ncbi:MAG: CBS domain-containing protein [Thaumarchaeota archaeon]|nr:CBS domain-containing protein [Nitrososphaerota archaeon]MDE1867312.1 CBS domain-containing protein [Nitrososphaerota archaeon]